MSLSAIEQLLTQAQRMNFSDITITGGEPLIYFEGVRSILEHCNNWTHLPKLKLCTNGIALDEQKISILKQYKGKIELNISLHAINRNAMSKITRKSIDIAKYEKVFQCLENNSIDYRVNSVLLKGINTDQQSLISFFDFLFDKNVKAVNLLELLVKKEQKDFYKYYESIEEIEKKIKAISSVFNINQLEKTNKKAVYILQRDNKSIKVVLFRLSCRCGCSSCAKENDIKIGADMILHHCYLKDVNCGNAVMNLEKAIEKKEEYMKSQDMDYSYNTLYWGE
jgi:molybdenum cofactor biosynthesis enzyme MoaA